jgi:hypothetical protein
MVGLVPQPRHRHRQHHPGGGEHAAHADGLRRRHAIAGQLDHRVVDDEQRDRAQHRHRAAQVAAPVVVSGFLHPGWIARAPPA